MQFHRRNINKSLYYVNKKYGQFVRWLRSKAGKFGLSVVADYRLLAAIACVAAYIDLAWTHLLEPGEWRAGIAYAIIACTSIIRHTPG